MVAFRKLALKYEKMNIKGSEMSLAEILANKKAMST